MFLLNKTNQDWWSVRKANGQDGFVPANYVHEIEPKVMQVAVRKPERISTLQRVMKTKLVKQTIPVKRTTVAKKSNSKFSFTGPPILYLADVRRAVGQTATAATNNNRRYLGIHRCYEK